MSLTIARLLLAAAVGMAQLPSLSAAQPGGTRHKLIGTLQRADSLGVEGYRGDWVVLHRVAPDGTGEAVDSVRSGADGEFEISFSGSADQSVYFASVQYHGVAYVSSFWRIADLDSARAEMIVYDTTSAPVPVRIAGRHVVLFAPEANGERHVVEVYEISNESARTRVSATGDVWSVGIVPAAENVDVGPCDLSPSAIERRGDRVVLATPFPPGLKQVCFAYTLAPGAFPLVVAIDSGTSVLEVLVEDLSATVESAGLEEVNPVSVQGRNLRRFLGESIGPGTLAIGFPDSQVPGRAAYLATILLLLGAAMLVMLAARFRSGPTAVRRRPLQSRSAEALAAEIAALDDAFAAAAQNAEARAAYESERRLLKQQLESLLARDSNEP